MLGDLAGVEIDTEEIESGAFLPLAKFAYNNSYQASLQMAPFEALYNRPCRSPLC